MEIKNNSEQIDFRFGINAVSYLEKESFNYTFADPTLNLFFNGDLVSSQLSKMFQGYRGKCVMDQVCKPNEKEYQSLQHINHQCLADDALSWCKQLPPEIDPELKNKAQAVLEEIVMLQTHQQIQRKLLLSA